MLFCCQSIRNLLTVFRVNVAACQVFTTWQAGQTRKGFANWQEVSGSGPAPISAPARWEHLPNPEITLRVSCAFLRFPIYTLTKNADILALFVFGCIIFTIVQHTWNSMAILIVMEVFLVLITAGTGVIEGVLQMASESLGVFMRS